jgi:hypothetical protein
VGRWIGVGGFLVTVYESCYMLCLRVELLFLVNM